MTCNRILYMLVILPILFLGCQNDDQGPRAGRATINGTITDASSLTPLAGVTVEARVAGGNAQTQTTNAEGGYEFTFEIDSVTSVSISCRNNTGYRDTLNIVATIQPNSSPRTLDIRLTPRSPVGGGSGSGIAQTIAFLGATPTELSVFGVGGNETSVLGWEVRDSLGLPIDAAHAVTLAFSFNGPGGGEYVSPLNVTTNAVGRAFTTLNSGIRSGVVQVIATATVTGRPPFSSQPVRIVIHSGFADSAHFTLGANRYNFPALGIIGLRNSMGVLVGDIYSNPVAENTAVYLATRAGVIIPTIFTSASGEGSADLISGNPYPVGVNAHTPFGDGYHYVIASTLGRNGAVIRDSILVLWTGQSLISNVSVDSIDVVNGGSQQIFFQVSDPYGNTLSAPTTISVSVTGPQAEVSFANNGSFTISQDIILPPHVYTQFSCVVRDATPDSLAATPASLTISVTSTGNGNTERTITGTIR